MNFVIIFLCVEIPKFSFWSRLFFGLLGLFRFFHFSRMCRENVIEHSISIKIAKIGWHLSKVDKAWLWSAVCCTKMTTKTIIFDQKIFTPCLVPVIIKCWPIIIVECRILVELQTPPKLGLGITKLVVPSYGLRRSTYGRLVWCNPILCDGKRLDI